MRLSSREAIPIKIREPQCYNKKSYLQLIKDKKVTFEYDIPNMKTEMNHNLLTQSVKISKQML